MAAATKNREGQRAPGEMVAYNGASGRHYYANTLLMVNGVGTVLPLAQGAGASSGKFLGFLENEVDLSGMVGLSNAPLNVYKAGVVTLAANGTGVSADIGRRAYGLDDQTVGTSIAAPALYVGEIVGLPSTSTYRVRIDNAVNEAFFVGLSGFT
jgi:hypothetical protein